MSSLRLKYTILGLIALFIISFLYFKTQSIDLDEHDLIINDISQFKQEDAVLNQHILEIRLGLLSYYDSTVSNLFKLKQIHTEVSEKIQQLCAQTPAIIKQRIESVDLALTQKQQWLETFKSSNAVLNNSLRYLPVATTQVLTHLAYNQQDNELRRTLNMLLRNTITYNMTNETGPGSQLNATVALLEQNLATYPSKVREDLAILISHINIVLVNKKQLDTLMQQLLSVSTTQHMDKLLQAYIDEYNKMMQAANSYRLLLYGFSVFLLAYIAYILFRLSWTTIALRRTVADLKYQKFAMDQHAIVSISDSTGAITYVNQKFCDISQRSPEELIGKNHRLSKSGFHPASFYKELWQTISQGKVWHGQIQNRAGNGSLFWVDTTIVPFMDDNQTPYQYVAIRTDITKIKKAEEQLRIQAAALKMAANSIVITDKNGTIQWVNDAFTQLTGYGRDETVGLTPGILKSGKYDTSFYQNMWNTINTGNVWHGELVNRRKDGSLYSEEQTISPVVNDQGEISHFIAIKQDISERQQTEKALRRSQKMEAIGQLSGGIAHDFNNQLGVILGYLDFLGNLFPEDEKPGRWVKTATRATLRCTDLTRQLLTFSRRQSTEKTVINLNTSLSELETMITRSLTPEVEVQYSLADDLWLTEINTGEFQDALLNLAINARDAMPKGGELRIETSNIKLDAGFAELNYGIEAGDYVRLQLIDTGSGMSKETLEHIFEPFFTTKAKGKGTGLGMAMVYGFVKRYNGYIKIDSEPGKGTTMRLYLPRSAAPKTTGLVIDANKTNLPTGSECILVVDDEADLLQLAGQYLSDLGYLTHLAENASQALEILKKEKGIHMLFTDVVMPGGINGYELAEQATQQWPDLKVLLSSGFTSNSIANNAHTRFANYLISKPYRKTELAKRIRQLLDERTAS